MILINLLKLSKATRKKATCITVPQIGGRWNFFMTKTWKDSETCACLFLVPLSKNCIRHQLVAPLFFSNLFFSATKYTLPAFFRGGWGRGGERLSTDETATTFSLLKSGVSLASVRVAAKKLLLNNIFRAPITPLERVSSTHEGNRKAYLQHHIIDRYYPDDSYTAKEFFAGSWVVKDKYFGCKLKMVFSRELENWPN